MEYIETLKNKFYPHITFVVLETCVPSRVGLFHLRQLVFEEKHSSPPTPTLWPSPENEYFIVISKSGKE